MNKSLAQFEFLVHLPVVSLWSCRSSPSLGFPALFASDEAMCFRFASRRTCQRYCRSLAPEWTLSSECTPSSPSYATRLPPPKVEARSNYGTCGAQSRTGKGCGLVSALAPCFLIAPSQYVVWTFRGRCRGCRAWPTKFDACSRIVVPIELCRSRMHQLPLGYPVFLVTDKSTWIGLRRHTASWSAVADSTACTGLAWIRWGWWTTATTQYLAAVIRSWQHLASRSCDLLSCRWWARRRSGGSAHSAPSAAQHCNSY